jgi:hypothetical protein
MTKSYADFISTQQAKLRGAGLVESSKVEWIPQPKVKPGNDGKISNKNFEQEIKTDAPKKEKPEGHSECKTCEGTGETKKFTGRAGADEKGVVHGQYVRQGCRSCGGQGHYNPEETRKRLSTIGQPFSSRFD